VAGQLGTDTDCTYPGGDDVVAQFDRALWNFLEVVRRGGGEPSHVVKMTFFVTDLDEWFGLAEELGPVYRRHFDRHYPAITLLQQPRLTIPGGKVEIEGVALVPPPEGSSNER
jgi:enamine deaminase RidA (YjgF/YER057c/UK114 family)